MARYLVSGAAGFIGSRVAEMLLEGGHQVFGIDNLNPAYDVRMKEYRLKRLLNRSGFAFEKADIADRLFVKGLRHQVPKFDAVINLAARAGVRSSVEDPWVYLEANTTGALNLLDLCHQCGIPKYILASTSSLYGAHNPMPYREDADTDRPLQPYAATKKGAEALAYSYHYLHGLDITVLRYFTVYGPAGRPDMVMFRFCQWIAEGRPVRINGDGEQTRAFTYVDDIARGTIQALAPLGYEIINLGGHEVISMNALMGMFEELLGKQAVVEHLPMHPADALGNQADTSKAQRVLGWKPQVPLTEGVSRLVDWYLAERSWVSQVATP